MLTLELGQQFAQRALHHVLEGQHSSTHVEYDLDSGRIDAQLAYQTRRNPQLLGGIAFEPLFLE